MTILNQDVHDALDAAYDEYRAAVVRVEDTRVARVLKARERSVAALARISADYDNHVTEILKGREDADPEA